MQNAGRMGFVNDESWTILNGVEKSIKEKIERIGIPLKQWGVSINRGILTGFNDAFIISSEKRDELIKKDPKSDDLIRPILRGRDIKRYSFSFADLWIIATFPSKGYNIDDYPAIKEHLLSFGIERLEQTGKKHVINGIKVSSRKKTNNKWFETQDSISYWDDLTMQKIIWGEISDKPKFAIDIQGRYYAEATTFLMTGEHLKYLLCFLNSTFSEYFFAKYGTTTGMGTLRWKKYLIELLPIPRPSETIEASFIEALDDLLNADEGEQQIYISRINNLVYETIGLSTKEISVIEGMVRKGAH